MRFLRKLKTLLESVARVATALAHVVDTLLNAATTVRALLA
jgi:hypothetical protein